MEDSAREDPDLPIDPFAMSVERRSAVTDAGLVSEVVVEPSPRGGHWNYRIVMTLASEVTLVSDDEIELDICKVYYDAAGTPSGYVRRAPGGATREEVREAYVRMSDAFKKPTLQWVDGKAREVAEEGVPASE